MVNKKDLTRIEDLSSFLHEDDPETNAILEESNVNDDFSSDSTQTLLESETISDDDSELTEIETLEEVEKKFEEMPFDSPESSDFSFDSEDKISDGQEEEEDSDAFSFEGEQTQSNFSSKDEDFLEEEAFPFLEGEEDDSEPQEHQDVEIDQEDSESKEFLFEETEQENSISKDFQFEESEQDETDDRQFDKTEKIEAHQDELKERFIEEKIEVSIVEDIQQIKPESLPVNITTPQLNTNLEDIGRFAKKMIYGKIAAEGSPAFSIKLTNIKFTEDADDILMILREHEFITKQNEKVFIDGLKSGSLLIAHISEYAAIYLSHRFRRLDLNLEMGPSQLIHKSANYKDDNFAPISKREIYQNIKENKETTPISHELKRRVFSSVGPEFSDFGISQHLGPTQSHKIVDSKTVTANTQDELNEVYKELLIELEANARKKNANGIIYLKYSISPINLMGEDKYQIICNGNMVKLIEN